MNPGSVIISMLKDEIARRSSKNRRYSLRAYARDLGCSPSTISEVLNGHHTISPTKAEAIADRLNWSAPEKIRFLKASEEIQNQRLNSILARRKREPLLSAKISRCFLGDVVEAIGAFEEKSKTQKSDFVSVHLFVDEV